MKKIIGFAFILLMCITLVGCGKETTGENNQNGDIIDNDNNSSDLGVGKYKVEKSGNKVLVITNDGSAVSTTEYTFDNGSITGAKVTQKYVSSAIAKTMKEEMEKEPEVMEAYADIKLSGNTITLTIKDEIFSAYNGFSQDDFYNLMTQTYSAYMEN